MRKPRAVVLFESSGVMREALRALGVEAYSCDLQSADDGSEHHYQCDVYELLRQDQDWDIAIAHPTCTKMCVSGNHVYAYGKPRHQERIDAVLDTERLWAKCKNKARVVVLENPIGVLTTMSSLPKPQYIQPFQCGDDASKKTALFMHGAGKIEIDKAIRHPGRWVEHNGKMVERWSNQTDSGQNRLGPSEDRWKVRSKTYPGVANIVAAHAVNSLYKLQKLAA